MKNSTFFLKQALDIEIVRMLQKNEKEINLSLHTKQTDHWPQKIVINVVGSEK